MINEGLCLCDQNNYEAPTYLQTKGMILRKLGKEKEAEIEFLKSIKVAEGLGDDESADYARFVAGENYVIVNNYSKAIEIVQSKTRVVKRNISILLWFIEFQALALSGKKLEAENISKHILTLSPKEKMKGLISNMGKILKEAPSA